MITFPALRWRNGQSCQFLMWSGATGGNLVWLDSRRGPRRFIYFKRRRRAGDEAPARLVQTNRSVIVLTDQGRTGKQVSPGVNGPVDFHPMTPRTLTGSSLQRREVGC